MLSVLSGWTNRGRSKTDPPRHHLVSTCPGLVYNCCSLADIQACILDCLMYFDSKRLEPVKLQMRVAHSYRQLALRPGGTNITRGCRKKLCSPPWDYDHTRESSSPEASLKNEKQGTSLVVQWLRACLLQQEKPRQREACVPVHTLRLQRAPTEQWGPSAAKNNKTDKF